MLGRKAVRQARGEERKRRYPHEYAAPPLPGALEQTFLERRRVRPATEMDYLNRASSFLQWAGSARLPVDDILQQQDALLVWMHEKFFEGEDAAEAGKLAAALMYLRGDARPLTEIMPRVAAARRGWHQVAPGRSRLPLPYAVAASIAARLMELQHKDLALLTMIAFIFVLRPSEAIGLQKRDLVPPIGGGSAGQRRAIGLDQWSLVLHPQETSAVSEGGRGRSKTGKTDESLTLSINFQEYGRVLQLLHRRRRQMSDYLFDAKYLDWAKHFESAARDIGAEILGPPVLYQLRHGGASHEALCGTPLEEIRKRGRWRSLQSVDRYEKGGRVAQQLSLLTPGALRHGQKCASAIGAILTGTCPPPPLPSDVASASNSSAGPETGPRRTARRRV